MNTATKFQIGQTVQQAFDSQIFAVIKDIEFNPKGSDAPYLYVIKEYRQSRGEWRPYDGTTKTSEQWLKETSVVVPQK